MSLDIGKRTSHEHKAAATLRAAYVCFAKHGYHGTTVDLICAEAGISKGALYWHYESKLAVFLAMLEAWASEVEEELEKQFSSSLSGASPLDDVFAAMGRESHRVRAILPIWLEFVAQAGRNEEMRAAIAKFHARIRDVIYALLAPSLSPAFSEAEVRAIAGTILGVFIGLVAQSLSEPEAADFEAHVQRVLVIIKRAFAHQR